ncbi:unnamed protein product [Polarella glacialis]|uniref:DUF559 domain-containing protein n=1 Tax=Polarella glacialis TaxID=89957 RepID=A0A813DRD9_POLGL|nr:unnamed protein product [Polarella glacialis]
MTWEWWQENVRGSTCKLDVTCNDCSQRAIQTSIGSMKFGSGFGCICRKKTEAKLLRWLQERFGQDTVTTQVLGCVNPETGRNLPFDFGLYGESVLIELDGDIGHFGQGWGGNSDDDGGVPVRDLLKERWAILAGRTVIRLLQADVYRNTSEWQVFLSNAVEAARADPRSQVVTQDSPKYKSGKYFDLRLTKKKRRVCSLDVWADGFHCPELEVSTTAAK